MFFYALALSVRAFFIFMSFLVFCDLPLIAFALVR